MVNLDRYHHGDLRAALIEAGMEMARAEGARALGMRDLTRAVGVSPNAAYRHFANLRALVLTVALEAQHRLSQTILDRTAAATGATDKLRAFALGYIDFALAQPGWFSLTCESREAPPPGPSPVSPGPPSPHELLLAALDAMVDAGDLSAERRVDAEWTCWSTAHGFALLATGGPLVGGDRTTLTRLAERAVDTLIRGLSPSR